MHYIILRLVLSYALVAALLYFFQSAIIFPGAYNLTSQIKGERLVQDTPSGVRSHFLDTNDGYRYEVWEIAATESSGESGTVVIFDGNAASLRGSLSYARSFSSQGYKVFIKSYRGFGRSTGRPSGESLERDILQFSDWLKLKGAISSKPLVALGVSVGGAAAAIFAEHVELDVLMLLSTFTSIRDIVERHLFYRFFSFVLSYDFDVLQRLKGLNYTTCVVLAHSKDDNVVPYNHFERLKEELYGLHQISPIAVERGGHMIFHQVSSLLFKELTRCLERESNKRLAKELSSSIQ